MKIIRTFVLTLLICLSQLVSAQDKYDFIIIEYTSINGIIGSSINGEEFRKERVDPKFNPSGYNANPLIARVKEWQEKEWEVMSFDVKMIGSNEVYFAYLRKKQTEKSKN